MSDTVLKVAVRLYLDKQAHNCTKAATQADLGRLIAPANQAAEQVSILDEQLKE
jgi:hypothetical protein